MEIRPQFDERVYTILRDCGDDFLIEYDSTDVTLNLHRHKQVKEVFFVVTKFYIYLFKSKGVKLYYRWPLRDLTIEVHDKRIVLTSAEDAAEAIQYALDKNDVEEGTDNLGLTERDFTKSGKRKAGVDSAEARDKRRDACFEAVAVDAYTDEAANEVEKEIALRMIETKRLLWRLETAENGRYAKVTTKSKKSKRKVHFEGEELEDEPEDDDIEDEEDEEEDLATANLVEDSSTDEEDIGTSSRVTNNSTFAKPDLTSANVGLGSNRFSAISTVLDSDVIDYNVLKEAFANQVNKSLTDELKSFVEDNAIRIEDLCKIHYPSFLNASAQCQAVRSIEAKEIQSELNEAVQVLIQSVTDIRAVAVKLVEAAETKYNMEVTASLLSKIQLAARLLQSAEKLLADGSYLNAVTVTQELVMLASTSLSSYVIGDYVLTHRAPAIRDAALNAGLAKANQWLLTIRKGSAAVGESLLCSRAASMAPAAPFLASLNERNGPMSTGGYRRKILFCLTDAPERWGLLDEYVPSSVAAFSGLFGSNATGALFGTLPPPPQPVIKVERILTQNSTQSDESNASEIRLLNAFQAVEEKRINTIQSVVSDGASVQELFNVAGQGEGFLAYYSSNRIKQLRIDLAPAIMNHSDLDDSPLLQVLVNLSKRPSSASTTTSADETILEAAVVQVLGPLSKLLCLALGTMVLEDVVFFNTSPKVLSAFDITNIWEAFSNDIANNIVGCANAIQVGMAGGGAVGALAPESIDAVMMTLVTVVTAFTDLVVANVRCSDLNTAAIKRALEQTIGNMVGLYLASHQMALAVGLEQDQLNPVLISSAEEFKYLVTDYSLNLIGKARSNGQPLLLPIPPAYRSGQVYMPFSSTVTTTVQQALLFLDRCLTLLGGTVPPFRAQCSIPGITVLLATGFSEANATPSVEDPFLGVNNTDAILIENLNVIFKFVSGSMSNKLIMLDDKASMQIAMILSNAYAVGVVVTIVEQRFCLWWNGHSAGSGGGYLTSSSELGVVVSNPQLLRCHGDAILLSESKTLFDGLATKCTEKLLNGLKSNFDDLLRPIRTLQYWKRKLPPSLLGIIEKAADGAGRRNGEINPNETEGFRDATDFLNKRIPQLLHILPPSTLQSIIGVLVMHASELIYEWTLEAIESYDGNEMRMIRGCVDIIVQELGPQITNWLNFINLTIPPANGAKYNYPFTIDVVATSLYKWVSDREAYWRSEAEHEMVVKANIEAVGRKVVDNAKDVTKVATKFGWLFGRKAVDITVATGKLAAKTTGIGKDKDSMAQVFADETPHDFVHPTLQPSLPVELEETSIPTTTNTIQHTPPATNTTKKTISRTRKATT